jgi:hypothetical protein
MPLAIKKCLIGTFLQDPSLRWESSSFGYLTDLAAKTKFVDESEEKTCCYEDSQCFTWASISQGG